MENNKNNFEFEEECLINVLRAPQLSNSSPNYAQELIDYINTESKTNSSRATFFQPILDNTTTFSPAPNSLFVTSQEELSRNAWKTLLGRII